MSIETVRLELLLYGPRHLLALIDGVQQFEAMVGLAAADGLRDFMVSGDVSPAWVERLRATSEPDPWVHGFGVVHRDSRSVIGLAAFKGPPDASGVVEIAYGIVPAHEGRGYATEAAAALVAFAFDAESVRLVRAHTLPTPNASTRVLTKCGFEHVGAVEDPEDGHVWRWELARQRA
jgi:RimJ/RimL family protein N-acetyltransferase